MRHENAARWPYLALAGIGLAAIPVAIGATAACKRRAMQDEHDSAPGHTPTASNSRGSSARRRSTSASATCARR